MDYSTPGLPVHHQLPELAQTHVHWVGDAIQPSHPLSPLLFPSSIFPSTRVFSNESALCIRWPKYWSFSFSISPSSGYSGLISFRIDWFDFLAVQGTHKNLLQHHSSKASILRRSAFFMVQLSHPYMTTGKTTALTWWTFVGKVISLLFNMLSRFVIVFLPRSKRLGISWLQSPSAVILEPKKIKVSHCFYCFPICLPYFILILTYEFKISACSTFRKNKLKTRINSVSSNLQNIGLANKFLWLSSKNKRHF